MMKKLTFIFCLLLAALSINAASPYNTKEKVINRCKAIAAYHVIHNRGGEFNKKAINASDVTALKKLIKSDPEKKFEKICNEILALKISAKDKDELVKEFEKILKTYRITDRGAIDQIKEPINRSEYPFETIITETKKTNVDNGDRDDDDDDETRNEGDDEENVTVSRVSSTVSSVVRDMPKEEDESNYHSSIRKENSDGFSLWGIVSALLGLGILALAYFYYQLYEDYKDIKDKHDIAFKALKGIEGIPDSYKKDLPNLTKAVIAKFKSMSDYDNLQKEVKDLNNKIKELNLELEKNERRNSGFRNDQNTFHSNTDFDVSQARRVSTQGTSTMVSDLNPSGSASIQREEEEVREKYSLIGKKKYLNFPQDDVFDEGTEEYLQGKSLYCMTYTSEETAVFEFVNKPENIRFAQQSRSSFLEEACIIENDDVETFSYIQTTEKGKLEKNADGWSIISKARIRLS